eukprot:CAMPEP_0204584052 /NCGR_PEP_ID=MMETSP0661-20131031/46118_1 /ASSEMBLY_ACC=CAM_ASM_000606 /TAXON_ID=109239 /ORGANISM="Alexandrium margalefi, Strain AMGDE01CS-322" /LENGTH=357 /DNA_ID=CAMNT_0051593463 /DNA_START=258 /DNA_END=1331 /DNA_ORIENTATION=-
MTRQQSIPEYGQGYTRVSDLLGNFTFSDGGLEGGIGNWTGTAFVEGAMCHKRNWEHVLIPYLLETYEPERVVDGEPCRILAVQKWEGNCSVCLGRNGVPREMNISLNPAYSGMTNAAAYALHATFTNVTVGPLREAFALPDACAEGPPPSACPYNVSQPTETVTVVYYSREPGKNCGLNNKMTNDLQGAITYFNTAYKYMQVFNVTVHKGFAPMRDCNYHPSKKAMVCTSPGLYSNTVRTKENFKSVGRSSENYMFGPFMGQCSENALGGSWYQFPSEGECAAGWDVGFNGCTWKTDSFKLIETQCVVDRLCEGVDRHEHAPFSEKLACLKRLVAECPDLQGPKGSTCNSRPEEKLV